LSDGSCPADCCEPALDDPLVGLRRFAGDSELPLAPQGDR